MRLLSSCESLTKATSSLSVLWNAYSPLCWKDWTNHRPFVRKSTSSRLWKWCINSRPIWFRNSLAVHDTFGVQQAQVSLYSTQPEQERHRDTVMISIMIPMQPRDVQVDGTREYHYSHSAPDGLTKQDKISLMISSVDGMLKVVNEQCSRMTSYASWNLIPCV